MLTIDRAVVAGVYEGGTLSSVFDRLRRAFHPETQASNEAAEAHSSMTAATRSAEVIEELDVRTARVLDEMEATQKLLAELRSMDAGR